MPIAMLNDPVQRIGYIKGKILKHAKPYICLGVVGVNENFQRNAGDIVKYRRFLPKGASASQPNRFFLDASGDRSQAYVDAHLVSEGVTPVAENVGVQDISAPVNQYGCVYGYTDKIADLHEDDIPGEMMKLVGERKALVMESALFGVLKGCTNKYYGGTGTSRGTVNGTLTLTMLRRIARSLSLNHATTITKMVKGGNAGLYGTSPVGRSYPVWVSTDLMPDLRELPGFVPVEAYGDSGNQ